MRAVLSIGSNMGDRWEMLRQVKEEFAAETVATSWVYATPAWGVEGQDDFLNAVLIVDVDQSPLELLHRGQRLEQQARRVRVQRWGPRTLDVDIVTLHDDAGEPITSDTEELRVPHPWAHERAFVLVPWLDADPEAMLGTTRVDELVEELDTMGIERVGKLA